MQAATERERQSPYFYEVQEKSQANFASNCGFKDTK